MVEAVSPRPTLALLVLAWLGIPQASTPRRYSPEQLACAAFREVVRSSIRSESGTIVREETAGRDGVVLMQAVRRDSGSGLALTAWYDSLLVYREGPEGRTVPDAEGLLGGRWRGTLTPLGRYLGAEFPFIPDEVAEIADLRGVMSDFLPLLAVEDPRQGTLRRLGDGSHGGMTVERYAWNLRWRADTSGTVNDTLVVPMRRDISESGTLSWDRLSGPVAWERTISVTGRIDPKGPIRRGMRSTVVQRVRVERIPNRPCP
jgi:hypothetical protein